MEGIAVETEGMGTRPPDSSVSPSVRCLREEEGVGLLLLWMQQRRLRSSF